jgi:hypothetical protein
MKRTISYMIVALALCVLTSVTAWAKGKSGSVTFYEDTVVGGTVVKKGTYNLKFNAETGEIAIMKGKTALVKTTARLEKQERSYSGIKYEFVSKEGGKSLKSVLFAGDKDAIVISENSAQAATPEK